MYKDWGEGLRVSVHTAQRFLVTETMILCFCVFEAGMKLLSPESLSLFKFLLESFSILFSEFPDDFNYSRRSFSAFPRKIEIKCEIDNP